MRLFGTTKTKTQPSGVVDLTPAPKGRFVERFVGQTFLGKYLTTQYVGEGSNAYVYLATLAGQKQPVVIKRIKDEAASAPRFRQFFDAEVRSMARFRHPYVVRLIDASPDDKNGACLVLDYISGMTLESVIQSERPMAAERVAKFLGPLGHALYAAQLAGIAHRDLKPANLMVTGYQTEAESLTVMDFGFAGFTQKPHIQMAALTGKGTVVACGTPAYVSPEMVRGDSTDARADIYSVGVILYEMLTGRLPFDFNTQEKLIEAHTSMPPPRFSRVGCDTVPAGVEAVVQIALSKYPSERHQSMKDLVDQFSRAIGTDIWAASAPAGYIYAESTQDEEVNLTAVDSPQPVPDQASDRFILSDVFEATLPEKLAALKLRGFIDDVKGEVIESEPGLIRVRVESPPGYKEPRSAGSGVFAFLSGVIRPGGAVRGKEPIEIELNLNKLDMNKVSVLVSFRPVREFPPSDPELWASRCEAYYAHLRRFIMPEG
jgi:eukaryotic-like serine/threonine-protein kinase